jgi:hypothetical protein
MFLLLLVGFPTSSTVTALQLTTRARSQLTAADLQDFLARPVHWPQIVASSNRVSRPDNVDVSSPLTAGAKVQEYFGLGLLKVDWICRQSTPGTLSLESPDGVPGIANDCSMTFEIRDNEVELTMGFNPLSPLAILATPLLVVDNWIALNVILPAAVDPAPLNSFRQLMGSLYGVAGVAHAADLWLGDSTLLTTAGIPVWADLSVAGQVYAALWCAVGPLAFWLSRQAEEEEKESAIQSSYGLADVGLVIYGGAEVLGALLAGTNEAFGNVVVVQVIVLAAWFYSAQRQEASQV